MINNPTTIMSIDLKKYRIQIYKSTLRLLGDPKYIQLLVNPNGRRVAIRSVEKSTSGDQSHKIVKMLMCTENSCDIYSRPFINKLREVVGSLDTNCSYRMTGEVVTPHKMAVFSMQTIKRIEG